MDGANSRRQVREMSKQDEQLSALLDGECSAQELDALLAELETSEQMAERFGRMAAARDALHGVQISAVGADFSAKVMAAIDAAPEENSERVTPLFAAPRQRSWRRPAAGLAVAASVAAVAFLGLRPVDDAPLLPPPPAVAQVQSSNAPVIQRVAEAPVRRPAAANSRVAATSNGAPNARLATYMIDYSNSRSAQGFGGALGYARVAAHAGNTASVQTLEDRR